VRSGGLVPTYAHDTVVQIPAAESADPQADAERLREIAKAITNIVVKGAHHEAADRDAQVHALIRAYVDAQRETVSRFPTHSRKSLTDDQRSIPHPSGPRRLGPATTRAST
jgi:hypothetical protein